MHQDLDDSRQSPLPQLAEGALCWIGSNLDRFFSRLSCEESGGDPLRDKAVVELALVTRRLKREPRSVAHRQLRELLDAAAIFEVEPFRERLARLTDLAATYELLHAVLREAVAAHDDCEHGRVQQRAILDVKQAADSLAPRHSRPSFRALAAWSNLERPIAVNQVTEQDAYNITHDVFYLTDWGCLVGGGLSPPTLRGTRRAVEALLGVYIGAANWDLVGELLLAAHFLDSTDSGLYRSGWQALCDAQLVNGAVPGPGYDPAEASARAGAEREEYVFKECYHPTLIAALVGALCPPTSPADDRTRGCLR